MSDWRGPDASSNAKCLPSGEKLGLWCTAAVVCSGLVWPVLSSHQIESENEISGFELAYPPGALFCMLHLQHLYVVLTT